MFSTIPSGSGVGTDYSNVYQGKITCHDYLISLKQVLIQGKNLLACHFGMQILQNCTFCSFGFSGSADQLKQFDTYMTALNSWCNEQQMSSVQQVPVYGQSVCVRHTDTDQWRRAQVTRLSDRYVESPVVLLHSFITAGLYNFCEARSNIRI